MVSGFYFKVVEINFFSVQFSSYGDLVCVIVDGKGEVMFDFSKAVFEAGIVFSISINGLDMENQVV